VKGCSGTILGLVIGAALAFAMLAALAVASHNASACSASQPASWSLRADLPAGLLSQQMAGQAWTLADGTTVTVRGAHSRTCQRLVVYADASTIGGWRVSNIGLELALVLDTGGGLQVQPTTLWFGRLPVPIGWLPRQCLDPLAQQVNRAVNSGMQQALSSSGLRVCGLASSDSSISVYLCPAG
jgi:hypothetical protein